MKKLLLFILFPGERDNATYPNNQLGCINSQATIRR